MASTSSNEYQFAFWQQNDIPNGRSSTAGDAFFVQLRVCNMLRRYLHDDCIVVHSYQQEFFIPRDDFLHEGIMHMLMCVSLSRLRLPEDIQDGLITQVFNFGNLMATYPGNAGLKTLPMVLSVAVIFMQQQDEDVNAATARAISIIRRNTLRVTTPRLLSTTKSSFIEALEKVRVDESSGLMEECAICLEVPSVGVEISSLPCSHVYHWSCIVRWLEKSNLCPLCRSPCLAD